MVFDGVGSGNFGGPVPQDPIHILAHPGGLLQDELDFQVRIGDGRRREIGPGVNDDLFYQVVVIGGVDEVSPGAIAIGPDQLIPIYRRHYRPRLGDLLPALGNVVNPIERKGLEGYRLTAGRIKILDSIPGVEDAAGVELEIIIQHPVLPGPGIGLPGGIDVQPLRTAQIMLRTNRRINRKLGRI